MSKKLNEWLITDCLKSYILVEGKLETPLSYSKLQHLFNRNYKKQTYFYDGDIYLTHDQLGITIFLRIISDKTMALVYFLDKIYPLETEETISTDVKEKGNFFDELSSNYSKMIKEIESIANAKFINTGIKTNLTKLSGY